MEYQYDYLVAGLLSVAIFGNHEYWFTEEKVKKMIKIIDI